VIAHSADWKEQMSVVEDRLSMAKSPIHRSSHCLLRILLIRSGSGVQSVTSSFLTERL